MLLPLSLSQRSAHDELHCAYTVVRRGAALVVHADDVRMIERASQRYRPSKPLHHLRFTQVLGMKNLQCDLALGARIVGTIHRAFATHPERLDDSYPGTAGSTARSD